MSIYKLKAPIKNYIWGGTRLRDRYGKAGDEPLAESWELSFHPDGMTALEDGRFLNEALSLSELGENCAAFSNFPLLVKLIDAKQSLSVQVHPSDAYALKHEGSYGKTEMWYIVEADEGAGIYLGFKRETSEREIREATENASLEKLLNFVPVQKGECYFIPAGTVHAIGSGCLICEVQQNSNLTYRIYDYGRKDSSGNLRPLHTEKALAVMQRAPYQASLTFLPVYGEKTLGISRYFHTSLLSVEGKCKLCVDPSSFKALFCVAGAGTVGPEPVKCGDSVLISAGEGDVLLKGEARFVAVSVRKYTVTQSETEIALVDDLGRIHAKCDGFKSIESFLSYYHLTKDDVEIC